MSNVTQILNQIESGDPSAADQLLPLVYDELRKLAAAKLVQEKPGQTLQATALVHEAYLRLLGGTTDHPWNGRGHFFAAAAEAMRRILIEQARKKIRRREKIGVPVSVAALDLAAPLLDHELVSLDAALTDLEQHDAPAAQLVKLRFFAGMTMTQAAEALDIPLRTAERNWAYARTWLHRQLENRDN